MSPFGFFLAQTASILGCNARIALSNADTLFSKINPKSNKANLLTSPQNTTEMHIKHCFHSEEDLAQKLGRSFMRMWRRLLEKYSKRIASLGVNALRLASLSFAFFSAAEEGNAEAMSHFDDMLHGWSAEKLWIGDTMVCFTDEEYVNFVWDGAALMLEADPDLPQKAQWAFDLAGSHVCYAYDVCQAEEVVLPSKYNEVKIDDTISVSVPKEKQEEKSVDKRFDFESVMRYVDTLTPEQMDDAKVIQAMLYALAGPQCDPVMHERIQHIPQRVSANRYLRDGQATVTLLADRIDHFSNHGPIRVETGDVNIKNYHEK